MKKLRFVPLFFWVLAICWLSFAPLQEFKIKPVVGVDKIAHVAMYGLLMWFLFVAQLKGNMHTILIIFAFALASATELIQHYLVPNRTGDWLDFIANCFGLIVVFLLSKRFRKS
ncbi:MAG: VanZ family protein [Vicingaceae bacterium]|jgi:VanZ family protein|tara:strand:+ start:543 stop:884 length:342 start_codon:yes stop_codon:yes gene_type:complete